MRTRFSLRVISENRIFVIGFLLIVGITLYLHSCRGVSKNHLPQSSNYGVNSVEKSNFEESFPIAPDIPEVQSTKDLKTKDDVLLRKTSANTKKNDKEFVLLYGPENPPDRKSYMIGHDEFQKNRTCKIPFVYPYEPYALKMLKEDIVEMPIPHCLANRHKNRFTTDEETRLIRLNTNDTFWKANYCCYVPFVGMDKAYKNLTECIDIVDDVTTIPSIWRNIQILCTATGNFQKNLTYRDYFHFFRLNSTLEKKLDEKLNKTQGYHPSVLIIGLDTVSFTNFQRFLPETRRFILEKLGGIEFYGMNKIGFGTMNNLIPMLSDCGWTASGETIFPGPKQECTQIWERFSARGYRTVYTAEECWRLLGEKMRHDSLGQYNVTYSNLDFVQGVQRTAPSALEEYGCFEHKWAFDILTERVTQASRKLRGKPYFHFAWSVLETHETIAMAQLLDRPFVTFLEQLADEDLFADTIFLLLSDHGMVSNGRYAGTYEGVIEANSPFLYIVLPTTFRTKYTTAVLNLERNSKGLVTPHDIYQTLLEILDLSTGMNLEVHDGSNWRKSHARRRAHDDAKGISLFRPIPLTRTCANARIPEQYCLCWAWTEMDEYKTDPNVQAAANYTVTYINQELRAYPDCLLLNLDKVQGAKVMSDVQGNTYFSIAFSTSPNRAKFQAMVKFRLIFDEDSVSVPTFNLVGNVERKNLYGKQSACLKEAREEIGWIRSVCLCKNFKFTD